MPRGPSAMPGDPGAMLGDPGAMLGDPVATPGDPGPMPDNLSAMPSDLGIMPDDLSAAPGDLSIKPCDVSTALQDLRYTCRRVGLQSRKDIFVAIESDVGRVSVFVWFFLCRIVWKSPMPPRLPGLDPGPCATRASGRERQKQAVRKLV